ncbi:MAG TPA: G1 family glutamic endopeptidase [Bosea sp. (in: a-proteobacteria)]
MTPGHGGHDGREPDLPRRARIETYGVPRDDFVPSRAPDSALIRLGLPTLNAMASNPKATAFRRAYLRGAVDGRPHHYMPALAMAEMARAAAVIPRAAPTAQPAQKSVNWSGGYLTPRDGHSFVSVMADWTVPTVSAPPGGTGPEYRSSTWIGLDGQRAYLDSSLPQIGTSQRCTSGAAATAQYGAWFQWWARGQVTEEEPLALPVDPGDVISAIITVFDETSVVCNLRNVTRDITLEAFKAFAPGPCRISGATAEWIMERPSPPLSDGWEAFELPVYTPFAFTACIAESQAPASTALHDRDLEGSRLIRMCAIDAAPTRVRTVSTARRVITPTQKLALSYVAP